MPRYGKGKVHGGKQNILGLLFSQPVLTESNGAFIAVLLFLLLLC
jgi:hypothetical protein